MLPEQFMDEYCNQHGYGWYGDMNKDELCEMIEAYAKYKAENTFPDTDADGYVFCGKCGKMK